MVTEEWEEPQETETEGRERQVMEEKWEGPRVKGEEEQHMDVDDTTSQDMTSQETQSRRVSNGEREKLYWNYWHDSLTGEVTT